MKILNFIAALLLLASCASCNNDLVEYQKNDIKVSIELGSTYLHDFPLFLGLDKKNPPQMAIWVEDLHGNYLTTIYATHKIATQGWQFSGGNRRKEALPCWCYARGVKYEDGLYLPTKKQPLTDGISGATPTKGYNVKMRPNGTLQQFVVKVEVNHSTDFNDSYPKSAKPGDANYSGGSEGSGQPAVVYAATVDLTSGAKSFQAQLIGHSSPDGTNGTVIPDVSSLTTALAIIKQITIIVQQ